MIPKLKKLKQEKSKLKVKRKRGKYIWELQKESKPKVIDWGRYIKVKVPVAPVKYVGKVFGGGQGGKKYGFAKMATIKKSNRKHTAHVLRLATERMLADKPAMILSSEGYSFEEAMERIKAMHEKKGQQKNAYLEIVCAYESEDLLKSYIQELNQKFQSEVFAVIHEDESVPHCHIVISWCNKQGKAIRLQKKDLWNLWETTIRRLQPSRLVPKQKGEGLPKVPYWAYRKAWLQGQEEYQEFCMEQWERWKLFYKWLNDEYNWDVPPPFRRKFFQEWLEEEQKIDITTAFKLLDTIAIKPQTQSTMMAKEKTSPGDVRQTEVKQAEGLLIFTTTEAPERNEVVVGGEVDAQQLVGESKDKKVVTIENRFKNKEDMMAAMKEVEPLEAIEKPLEDKEKLLKGKVGLATIKKPLEDRKDEVVAMVVAKKEPKVMVATEKTEDKKEPKKTEEPDIVLAKKETEESKEKERIEEKVVLTKKETEDRKKPKEERTEKVAVTKGDGGWTENLWDTMKELNKREKEKKKQIKELEEAIFRSFSQVKTSNKGKAHRGAK